MPHGGPPVCWGSGGQSHEAALMPPSVRGGVRLRSQIEVLVRGDLLRRKPMICPQQRHPGERSDRLGTETMSLGLDCAAARRGAKDTALGRVKPPSLGMPKATVSSHILAYATTRYCSQ